MDAIGLRLQGLAGLVLMIGLCVLVSTNRRAIKARIIVFGVGLQFVFALIVLKTRMGRAFFQQANDAINGLIDYAREGNVFLFGTQLADPKGPVGFVFAVQVLMSIVFFASLMAVLYHVGIMQLVVKGIAYVMQRTLKTSGAETLSAAANIFVGQTEAPLLIKPFLAAMTLSELMAVMTLGFGTVAGGVMASYVGMLKDTFPDIAGHLLACSVMSAPAGLMISKLMLPETEQPTTANAEDIAIEKTTANVIDAAASGASEGMTLVLNVVAMLFAFVSLVALTNGALGWIGAHLHVTLGGEPLSLQAVFQYVFSPLAWMMGVEAGDRLDVGRLLGSKLVLTEFIAYVDLSKMGGELSERSYCLASYALCGFANLGSIGIQLGGIGAMAPGRRRDLARIGMKAMWAGFLTTCMTAAVAGIVLGSEVNG